MRHAEKFSLYTGHQSIYKSYVLYCSSPYLVSFFKLIRYCFPFIYLIAHTVVGIKSFSIDHRGGRVRRIAFFYYDLIKCHPTRSVDVAFADLCLNTRHMCVCVLATCTFSYRKRYVSLLSLPPSIYLLWIIHETIPFFFFLYSSSSKRNFDFESMPHFFFSFCVLCFFKVFFLSRISYNEMPSFDNDFLQRYTSKLRK